MYRLYYRIADAHHRAYYDLTKYQDEISECVMPLLNHAKTSIEFFSDYFVINTLCFKRTILSQIMTSLNKHPAFATANELFPSSYKSANMFRRFKTEYPDYIGDKNEYSLHGYLGYLLTLSKENPINFDHYTQKIDAILKPYAHEIPYFHIEPEGVILYIIQRKGQKLNIDKLFTWLYTNAGIYDEYLHNIISALTIPLF